MDDIPKSATWILGGASVATVVVTLVGLAPRLAGTYPLWVQVAIGCILTGLVCGCAAVIFQLIGARTTPPRSQGRAIVSVAIGMAFVVAGTGVLAVSYSVTLSKEDVPRVALSVAGDEAMATIKVKFEADGLDPGQSLIVDIIAVDRKTPVPSGVSQMVPGHRIYRAAIGSDSTGKVTSEIETVIQRADYKIVVAEVWPGPLDVDSSAPNNQSADTKMCGNVGIPEKGKDKKAIRSCAYAAVPPNGSP
jgi:hypothetical protein